ncbi:MAG: YfiR family protein [Verrucomicrobiales bacterium]
MRGLTNYLLAGILKGVGIMAIIFAAALPNHGHAQGAPKAAEYEIKAAFILNFAKFTEWPSNKFESTNAPIIIGILGEDPFDGSLERVLKGKTISGRAIHLERYRTPAEARKAHVLFMGDTDRKRVGQQLTGLTGANVLTVSEMDGFAETGGMIGFTEIADRVRFEINPKAADKEQVKISSKLLSLATKIAR